MPPALKRFRIEVLAVNDNPQGDENFIERVISTEDLIEGDGVLLKPSAWAWAIP